MIQKLLSFFKRIFTRPITLGQKRKLAVILSGGAMNCAYSAGFLAGLEARLKKTNHFIIAASGSAGNATYYASGQGECGRHAWLEYLSGEQLIHFTKAPVLDIDYLVDTVFKKTFPLDLMGLRSSKVEVVVPAVTYESGEVAYFSSKDASLDWFEVLRAAKALPLVYNKKIKIGDKHYFDTPASSSWSLHIEKALAMGATHFLIVDLNQYYKSKQMTKLMGYLIKKYTFKNSENSYNSEPIFRDDFTVSNDFHHYVRPNRFIGNLDARVESLRMMWEDGYAYGVKDEGLKNFLEQF